MASLDAVALISRNPDFMGSSFYATMTDAQAVEWACNHLINRRKLMR
jgi:hypothetical protein